MPIARWSVIALTLVAVLSGVVSVASAGATVQARGQDNGTIFAGGGGRFVWSRWDPHKRVMRLVETRDDRTRTLGVRSRPTPFDVQLGTDRAGHAVAVYSRCKVYPTLDGPPRSGKGCRLYEYSFSRRSERTLVVKRPHGATSMFLPTIWRGQIAFAALIGRRRVPAIFLQSRTGRLQRVRIARPGGDNPLQGTTRGDAEGPGSLALRDGVLAYHWEYDGQRPDCGADGSFGPAPNDMIVTRLPNGVMRLIAHSNCASDLPTTGVALRQLLSDRRLRYLASVRPPAPLTGNYIEARTVDMRTGTPLTSPFTLPPRMGGYVTDGRGHVLALIGSRVETIAPLH